MPKDIESLEDANKNKITADTVKERYMRLFHLLHFISHLIWLHLHVLIVGQLANRFAYGDWSPRNRKILIIGDETALGVGDWVLLGREPGLQGRLNSFLTKAMTSNGLGRGLWTAMTSAKSGSTSADWLPCTEQRRPSRAAETDAARAHRLFERAFDGRLGAHRDADVVVLVVGGRDRCPIETTAANIKQIAKELLRRGKPVVIMTPPICVQALKDHREAQARAAVRNAAYVRVVEELEREEAAGGSMASLREESEDEDDRTKARWGDTGLRCRVAPIRRARVALAAAAESLERSEFYRFQHRTLNGVGYTRAAEVVYDALTPLLRLAESGLYYKPNQ